MGATVSSLFFVYILGTPSADIVRGTENFLPTNYHFSFNFSHFSLN